MTVGWAIAYKDGRDAVVDVATFEECLDILFSQHAYFDWTKKDNGIFAISKDDDTEIASVFHQYT